jgi:hypothetical protein
MQIHTTGGCMATERGNAMAQDWLETAPSVRGDGGSYGRKRQGLLHSCKRGRETIRRNNQADSLSNGIHSHISSTS